MNHFLITGCGHSGTAYMSELMTFLGISCGHEAVPAEELPRFEHALHDRHLLGDSSWVAADNINHLQDGTLVVHLIRNPIKVIRSFCGLRFFSADARIMDMNARRTFVSLPEIWGLESEVDMSALYWIVWNRVIQFACKLRDAKTIRLRLEDTPQGVHLLTKILHRNIPVTTIERIAELLGTKVSATGVGVLKGQVIDSSINLESISKPIRERLIRCAESFGYSEEELATV